MKKKNNRGLMFAIAIVVVLTVTSLFWYKKMSDGRTRLEHFLYGRTSVHKVLKVK